MAGTTTYCPYCLGTHWFVGRCFDCGVGLGADPTEHPFELPAFTVLRGRYLVGRQLGMNNVAHTYLARDLKMADDKLARVTIREYCPMNSARRQGLEVIPYSRLGGSGQSQIRDEAPTDAFAERKGRLVLRARAALGVMNELPPYLPVARVVDVFEENGTAYVVTEHVEGLTLEELLKAFGSGLGTDETLRLFEPIVKVLSLCHERGLVHGSLHPGRLHLSEGRLILRGFGIEERDLDDDPFSASLAGDDIFIESMRYAPVDWCSKQDPGPWTDVYMLCAVVYRCITGERVPNLFERITQDDLRRPSELGASLSPCQEDALMKGLTLIPSQRTQSVSELWEGLYG